MKEYDDFVNTRLALGEDPNVITSRVEDAIERTGDWALWGDETWRLNTVCPKCGSPYPGICGSSGPSLLDCKGCTDERPVMYREFLRRQEALKQAASDGSRP